jgi:hypothetical protein
MGVTLRVADHLARRLTQARPTRSVPFTHDRAQHRAAFLEQPTPTPGLLLGSGLVLGMQPARQPGEAFRRVEEVEDDQLDAREVLPEPVLLPLAAVGQPDPCPLARPFGPSSGANSSSG